MTNNMMIAFISDWLREHEDEMQVLLKTLVNIDSFTYDDDDVVKVRNTLGRVLSDAGVNVRLLDEQDTWALLAEVNPFPVEDKLAGDAVDHQRPVYYLTGHMDTVFCQGTVAERPYQIIGKMAYGPGVADMKAGLVMNAFIMLAFHQLNQQQSLPFTLKMLATGDEEIGSPNGQYLIRRYVAGADAVFNAEPGRISGNVVSARKGGGTYQIEVTGKAAHSGVNHADGISAIEALARIIQSVHQLTDYDAGITTNVGLISGGRTPNTVAPSAQAKLDVRFKTLSQVERIEAALNDCVTQHGVAGAVASIKKIAGFLPFEAAMSEHLLALYRQQASLLGLDIDGEFTGGCSDAGWTASMGIPTLCGTGPVGGHAHTEREFCDLSTLVERATLVGRSLLALSLSSS